MAEAGRHARGWSPFPKLTVFGPYTGRFPHAVDFTKTVAFYLYGCGATSGHRKRSFPQRIGKAPGMAPSPAYARRNDTATPSRGACGRAAASAAATFSSTNSAPRIVSPTYIQIYGFDVYRLPKNTDTAKPNIPTT